MSGVLLRGGGVNSRFSSRQPRASEYVHTSSSGSSLLFAAPVTSTPLVPTHVNVCARRGGGVRGVDSTVQLAPFHAHRSLSAPRISSPPNNRTRWPIGSYVIAALNRSFGPPLDDTSDHVLSGASSHVSRSRRLPENRTSRSRPSSYATAP